MGRAEAVLDVLIAFFLDMLFGDPVFSLHPVRLIGSMLTKYEKLFYRMMRKAIGGALLVALALATVVSVMLVLNYVKRWAFLPFSINVVSVFLLFFLFCNRDMAREARSVYDRLSAGDLEGARLAASRIVGRDTGALDRRGVIRATVESVAENVVDGFTAPLFYFMLGGFPAAYAYKTINTIDSRFGYRNERYEKFGKTGARLDDVFTFVPARINAVFLYCASGFRREVFRCMWKDGQKQTSPNSGLAEAGFSALLGIALGGPSTYGGVLKKKPWIGIDRLEGNMREEPELILKGLFFYWRVVFTTLFVFLTAAYFLGLPLRV
jgi:adenosylcobinamide-phosphate synthase